MVPARARSRPGPCAALFRSHAPWSWLLPALLVAAPCRAADGVEEPTVGPSPTVTPAPPVEPPTSEPPCSDAVRRGPGEAPCHSPHLARVALAVGGVLAFASGAAGTQIAGDSLAAGDPFPQLVGLGFIGALGAGTGALVGLLSGFDERPVDDRASSPTLTLTLAPGTSSTLGEQGAWSLGGRIQPRLLPHPALSLEPFLDLSTNLNNTQEVDARPQAQREDGTFAPGLSHRGRSLEWGLDARLTLPSPRRPTESTAAGSLRSGPLRGGPLDLVFQHQARLIHRTRNPGEPDEQRLESLTLLPIVAGIEAHLSARQSFRVVAGPRWDRSALTDPGGTELRGAEPLDGAFYAEAWYEIDVPFRSRGTGRTQVSGRLSLGYVHDRSLGARMNGGASIGFFGPLQAAWDLRLRRRGAPVAAQVGLGAWIGEGGGAWLRLGLVTPSIGSAG